jgi:hypothetical protein
LSTSFCTDFTCKPGRTLGFDCLDAGVLVGKWAILCHCLPHGNLAAMYKVLLQQIFLQHAVIFEIASAVAFYKLPESALDIK